VVEDKADVMDEEPRDDVGMAEGEMDETVDVDEARN
jgi:hypothetical protein